MNSLLKFIYHPMAALSLALHVLLLLVPLPSETQPAPEQEPQEEEIKLSSISSLKLNPSPTQAARPIPKPAPKPVARAVLPSRPSVPNPFRPPLPSPTTVATPTPTVTPTLGATPTPAVTPTPEPSPTTSLAQGQLQSGTVSGVGQASAAQFYSFFPDPSAFFTANSLQQADINLTDPVPVEGITNMTRLENKGIDQVRNELLPQLYPGASFTQVGTYGDGDLYEVKQGNSLGYVVLIKEKSLGLATYVVEWAYNPNQASSQTAGASAGGTPAQ